MEEEEMKRIFGAFYGQLVGDALGARYEFKSANIVQKMIQNDMVDGHLPLLGGRLPEDKPGQVTDDSEMALTLAESLIRSRGFDHSDIASSYALWCSTKPPDIGLATSAALSIPAMLAKEATGVLDNKMKKEILKLSLEQAKDFNEKSLSNGMLMRISPLAIALRNSTETKLLECAKLDCSITHQNPIVIQATQFYVKVLVNLLKGNKNPEESIESAKKVVNDQTVLGIISDSVHRATPVKLPDGREINGDQECMGYFGVALQSALYELRTSKSFEESLVRIISIGGDTDTNGCIGAALLGARFGVDAIPKDWMQTVLDAPVDRDYSFMAPIKNKTVDSFVRQLARLS